MDFSHDRIVYDHSIVMSIVKLSMLTYDLPSLRSGKSDVSMLNFTIDTTIEWSIPTIDGHFRFQASAFLNLWGFPKL